MKKKQTLNFIASVKEEYLDSMERVAEQLKDRGCKITNIHRYTGVITGMIDKSIDLDNIRVEGLASLEEERIVRKNQKLS